MNNRKCYFLAITRQGAATKCESKICNVIHSIWTFVDEEKNSINDEGQFVCDVMVEWKKPFDNFSPP